MPQPWRPRLMLSLLETSKRMSNCSCQLWLEDWDLRANLLLPACLPTKITAVKTKTSPVGVASPLTRGNRCKDTNNSKNCRIPSPRRFDSSALLLIQRPPPRQVRGPQARGRSSSSWPGRDKNSEKVHTWPEWQLFRLCLFRPFALVISLQGLAGR